MRTGIEVNFHYIPSKEFPHFFVSPCVRTNPSTGTVEYTQQGRHHVRFFETTEERDEEQKKYEALHGIRCNAGTCIFGGNND